VIDVISEAAFTIGTQKPHIGNDYEAAIPADKINTVDMHSQF